MNFILPKVLHLIDSKRYSSETGNATSAKASTSNKGQQENIPVKRDIYKSSLQMIQQLKQISKDDNLHLIIPLLIRVITRQNYSDLREEIDFKIDIVRTMNSLIFCKSYREYIATIVHSMINVVEVYQTYNFPEAEHLHKSIVELFCNMARYLNIDFAPFIPLIMESFKRSKKPAHE